MSIKPATMRWVALDLLVGVIILFAVLWIKPWGGDEAASGSGGGVAVKVDAAKADEGKSLANSNGCTGCHSLDGAAGGGPTWKGLYGSTGKTLGKKVDDAYIVEILKNPPPAMASFKGKFDETQSKAIAEYIKSLAN